jgi:hypothetical protein
VHGERRAAAEPVAVRRDASTVGFDDVAGNRQAESQPAAVVVRVGLTELVEDVGEEVRLDADAAVLDPR